MRRVEHLCRPLLLTGLLALATLARAAPGALDDFRVILPRLQPPQRAQLQERAAQWASWTPLQRQDFAHRASAWNTLSAAERGRRREGYAAWRALPADERARIQVAAARWRLLDRNQQQAWRARFDALDGSDQRGWMLGPALGADYPRLQPLLAQLPASEHAQMLDVLRGMTSQQRAELAVLVQRTPPQHRPGLRKELLSTSAANRQTWLWQRLDR